MKVVSIMIYLSYKKLAAVIDLRPAGVAAQVDISQKREARRKKGTGNREWMKARSAAACFVFTVPCSLSPVPFLCVHSCSATWREQQDTLPYQVVSVCVMPHAGRPFPGPPQLFPAAMTLLRGRGKDNRS